MAKLLKLRRGTTSQHGSFTGAEGEVTVDTNKDTLVVHDGSTAGGHPVAAEDMANVSSASIVGRLGTGSIGNAKLTDDSIAEVKLDISNAPSDGKFLQYKDNTDKLTWTDVDLTSIAGTTFTDDVTFNGASHNVMWDKSENRLEFWDNAKVSFGDPAGTPDLSIYHDGSNSYIHHGGTGNLITRIGKDDGEYHIFGNGNSDIAKFVDNAQVELYHNGTKRLETKDYGVKIGGDIWLDDSNTVKVGSSGDLQLYHDSTNSYIKNTNGELRLLGSTIKLNNAANTETCLKATENGAVELYHDDNKKLETTSGGITVTGTITGNLNGNITGTATTVTQAAQSTITSLGTLTSISLDGQYKQSADALTPATTPAVDCSLGNFFTLDASSTYPSSGWSFTNVPGSVVYTVVIKVTTGSSTTINWNSIAVNGGSASNKIKWNGGAVPAFTAGSPLYIILTTTDTGATWEGCALIDFAVV